MTAPLRAGIVRVTGHFGELLQGRIGPGGPLALVTLPCPALWVEARRAAAAAAPAPGRAGLLPSARTRALRSALALPDPGPVALRATMPRGGGAGASTAALVAYARLAGSRHGPLDLARACLAAEGATDPLMFAAPERLLWASRQGEVLEDLPPLPPFEVVGGFFGPNRRTDPADAGFPDISDLISLWRGAAAQGDLPKLAGLAALSAERSIRHRGPAADPTARLAADLGALGHAIAHTGSARALIFAPGAVPEGADRFLARRGLRHVIRFRVGDPA